MDILETDLESGLVSETVKVYLARLGVTLKTKGVGAHIRMLEKHHDILRRVFLRLVVQLAEEGIKATADHILSCALTAKNSLFTVGDSTPMMATFGRQPAVLPNIEQATSMLDDSHTGPDGLSRGRHRIRELAVLDMVETTAAERARRAANSKTRTSAQAAGLQAGEMVEFHRSPGQKETVGWKGPAEVLKIDEDGNVHILLQGTT